MYKIPSIQALSCGLLLLLFLFKLTGEDCQQKLGHNQTGNITQLFNIMPRHSDNNST